MVVAFPGTGFFRSQLAAWSSSESLHKIGRAAQRREDQKSFWPYDIDWFQAKID